MEIVTLGKLIMSTPLLFNYADFLAEFFRYLGVHSYLAWEIKPLYILKLTQYETCSMQKTS